MPTNSRTRNDSSQLRERAATIAKDVHNVGDAAKKVAIDSADAVRDTAREYLDEGTMRIRHLGDTAYTQLRDQPIKAVLIAAGIGFLLGAIWTRR
jgi:ElaB/YqjD/DUF883 family membrane-anchored ribosome-binding protein